MSTHMGIDPFCSWQHHSQLVLLVRVAIRICFKLRIPLTTCALWQCHLQLSVTLEDHVLHEYKNPRGVPDTLQVP